MTFFQKLKQKKEAAKATVTYGTAGTSKPTYGTAGTKPTYGAAGIKPSKPKPSKPTYGAAGK